MANERELILRIEGISKRYGGVHALEEVSFDLRYGEVHALVGENGAGKSTLIKVLGGIIPRDGGRIFFEGHEVTFNEPSEAKAAGIAIIHQELSVLPTLNVMENLFMGQMSNRAGVVNWRDTRRRTREALALVDLHVDPRAIVKDLSISQRQMIEIARALSANAKLIVMDEPNSSLAEAETERLFNLINDLKARGIAFIYVSHKIGEVMRISDRITVLRDGRYVGTRNTSESSVDEVVRMMVGRELDREQVPTGEHGGATVLEVRNLCSDRFTDVSFDVRAGEIVAFSGLVGAGRSETLRAVFGADRYRSGDVLFQGKPARFATPADAIKCGIAMVPEDRKVLSLFTGMRIMHNVSIAELPHMSRAGNISHRRERGMVSDFVKRLDIRLSSIFEPVSSLSGGNQQKTVLARWLATNPKLLILDEPTHGVDVGAKAEIYALMRNLARSGVAIVLISSELPEVLALANRIVVMCEGRVTGILNRAAADEETLMTYATGVMRQ